MVTELRLAEECTQVGEGAAVRDIEVKLCHGSVVGIGMLRTDSPRKKNWPHKDLPATAMLTAEHTAL